MTAREEILALAKACGATTNTTSGVVELWGIARIEAFFHAAQALAYEECTNICDRTEGPLGHCAAAIRARITK